jgi:MtrB/PioB family decaheme-associated outer membrane protein
MAPMMQGALAADADMPVKAVAPVDNTPWWTHGFMEVGDRGFLNDPTYGGHIVNGQGSLAKYYEYSTVKPGAFGDFNVAAGSKNGLYEIDVWGKNVGYDDQRYNAYLSKAGEQYFNFTWDQTPHVYSTSAQTLFNTNGNALTLANPNIGAQMFNAGGTVGFPTIPSTPTAASLAKTNAIGTIINANVHPTDIGIVRDTAAVEYRYTPNDNWDIKANYSRVTRTGSQVDSVLFTDTNTGSRVDVAKPVNDTTQNFGVNGEYIGTSAWGQKFNAMVGYMGSVYKDSFADYTVQNSFCNGAVCAGNGNTTATQAMMSTPPDNSMNGVSGTIGADLPLNSRYMGTVSYSGMRQNQQFLPFSINPVVLAGGGLANNLATLPAQSLNGEINTLLVNNVVTSQITSDLKTKLSYRYYDYDNQTPQLQIADWAIADATSAKGFTNNYAPVDPLMVGYIKQNGAAEATYRPVNSVNLGASYGVEHYDFTRFDALSTTEGTVKLYGDWKPATWVTARASASYGERRASDYDYLGNVGMFQWPVPKAISGATLTGWPNSTNYSEAYRQFYLDDRNRSQAKFQIDIDVIRGLTVTPTINIRNDGFLLTQNQLGLTKDDSTAAGLELAYAATPDLKFLFSYMNEQRNQQTLSSSTILAPYTTATAYTCPTPTTCQEYMANINDRVNTFIVGVNYAFIPQRFELGLNYTLSMGKDSSPLTYQNGTGPVLAAGQPSSLGTQFPDVNTTFQRLEATAKYTLDPDFVHSMGWAGGVSLKLRYAWERNSVTNWNNDTMQPYMYQILGQSQVAYYQALASDNPNYNVHMIGGTIAWAW